MKKTSILSFDAVKESETGAPLTLKNPDGSDTILTLQVQGANASKFRKVFDASVREKIKQNELNEKAKGKKSFADDYDSEKLTAENAKLCAARVVGWSGVDEEFSEEILVAALIRNPHWVGQIEAFSNDLTNFMRKA